MEPVLQLGLRQALESGDCVLFIGAGIGCHLHGADGEVAPDGTGLAKDLASHFSIDVGDAPDLAKVAQLVEIRKKGRAELITFLKRRLGDLEPDDTLAWIASRRWRAIFTTNYDDGIERAYARTANPPQTPVAISATAQLQQFDRRIQVPVYHLHGALVVGDDPRILITEDDYAHFRDRRRMLFSILKQEFATSTFLYIGYSNRDPNWRLLLDELSAEFYPAQMPPSYRIAPHTDPLDEEILRSKGIETIAGSYQDFQSLAAVALAGSTVPADVLKRIEETVPSDLLPAFEKNAAAVARLLTNWQYVNQAPFSAQPNVRDFLRGNRPNWALVARRLQFERDMEPELYEDLLDYVTSSAKRPSQFIVLGPAGYGTTTALMSIAARIVHDRVGPVFVHREGMAMNEGDVEFAASVFTDTCTFVVDNVSDFAHITHNAVHRLASMNRPAVFLLGERLNEWQYGHGRLTGHEYLLEALSDAEINRLLDCLSANNELGKLRDLNRDLQFAAIKQRHEKQLLVAMREATEGLAFDAILEDEYRKLPSDIARRMYLAVCSLYQHGALVRDGVLASVLNTPLTDLYAGTATQTEGVVIFEEIDNSYGHYAARARHRTIAAVVWERCAELSEREQLVLAALNALNLNYAVDAKAFDQLVRADRLVDAIRTLEGKIRFFERACKIDPNSPYVRQHYARMLSRSEQPLLALSQIEQALELDDDLRVLHHTRGVILAQLAITLDSLELARKRLVQAEHEFRRCISMYARDEYAYQTLAQLYVDWAKRLADEAEAMEYFGRAEDVVSEGLRNVRVRDGLWIVSSRISEALGQRPDHLAALKKAVSSTPGSVIARYLLGRAYRRDRQSAAAMEVLRPVVEHNQDEFRVFVEYARAMYDSGESYSKCIAVLRQSTLYGLGDPRFVATLGGMLLMNGEFTEAKAVFSESVKRSFPALEAKLIQFKAKEDKDRTRSLRMRGKLVSVKAGYCFVGVRGLPDFLLPTSRVGNTLLREGIMLEFDVAFSARGAVADRPELGAESVGGK